MKNHKHDWTPIQVENDFELSFIPKGQPREGWPVASLNGQIMMLGCTCGNFKYVPAARIEEKKVV